jgi:hypothetical protein
MKNIMMFIVAFIMVHAGHVNADHEPMSMSDARADMVKLTQRKAVIFKRHRQYTRQMIDVETARDNCTREAKVTNRICKKVIDAPWCKAEFATVYKSCKKMR